MHQLYSPSSTRKPMVHNPMWAICERMAEVQALLDDHMAGGKHTAADVIAKASGGPIGIRRAAGDVRCRLLPAEHAAGRMNGGNSLARSILHRLPAESESEWVS
jgi:hypothetical protein